jgi:predicted lipoprotein with Yx(FWY)xxD motif
MKKTAIGKAVIGVAAALLLSGCGSSGGTVTTSNVAPTIVSSAAAHNPKLRGAEILVDSKGFALYAFSKDPENTLHLHCEGGCESTWPALILSGSAPVASGQALGTQLGAVKTLKRQMRLEMHLAKTPQRQAPGRLRRPPALHLCTRTQARPGARQRRLLLRRDLACADTARDGGLAMKPSEALGDQREAMLAGRFAQLLSQQANSSSSPAARESAPATWTAS